MRNEPWIYTRDSYEISTTSFFMSLMQKSSKQFFRLKDFQSDQIQRRCGWKIQFSLRKQECQFEFDTSYGND